MTKQLHPFSFWKYSFSEGILSHSWLCCKGKKAMKWHHGIWGSYNFLGQGMVLNVTYTFTALAPINELEVGRGGESLESMATWWNHSIHWDILSHLSSNIIYSIYFLLPQTQLLSQLKKSQPVFFWRFLKSWIFLTFFLGRGYLGRWFMVPCRQVWLGTSDDWIGSSDRPSKEQGTVARWSATVEEFRTPKIMVSMGNEQIKDGWPIKNGDFPWLC